MKKAIILFSGGLDSTTCLALAKSQGFTCYAISYNYGQKQVSELNAAKKIAKHFKTEFISVELPIFQFGGSALTDDSIEIPAASNSSKIPSTYVPARNTIFLSFALGWSEALGANDIFIGSSFVDYSGYPDCRPEYFEAFQQLANLATKVGVEEGRVKIHTPLLYLSKAETILLGLSLGVDYSITVTCYRADENGKACGTCDSCALRKKGFAEAGVSDVTVYA